MTQSAAEPKYVEPAAVIAELLEQNKMQALRIAQLEAYIKSLEAKSNE